MRILFAFVLAAALSADYAQGTVITGLTSTNGLQFFDSAAPGTVLGAVPVTGLVGGDTLAGIDYRPATGQLFGIAVNGTTAHLYILDTTTGAATQVGGDIALPESSGVSAGTVFGFDFNPTVDRIRVFADSRDNFRLNPNTGAVAGVDTALTAGSVLVAGAYDRNFAGPVTTLYAIDAATGALVIIGGIDGSPSPNTGVVTPIGALGITFQNLVGLDIEHTGIAYASFIPVGGGPTSLYTINLSTGAATLIGGIGGSSIIDISAPIPEPATYALCLLGLAGLWFARRRSLAKAQQGVSISR